MKKLVTYLLVLVMILSFPLTTSAINSDQLLSPNDSIDLATLSKSELDSLAIQAFPEFAEDIHGANLSPVTFSSASQSATVVYSGSRSITDDILLILKKLSNGIVEMAFQSKTTINSSSSGSGYSLACVDIYVTSNVSSQSFIIKNFTYTLIGSAYDQINDFGIVIRDTSMFGEVMRKSREDINGPACYCVTAIFDLSTPYSNFYPTYSITMQVDVGANQAIIDIY